MKYQIFTSGVILILVTMVQSEKGSGLNKPCLDKYDCSPFGYICGYNRTCQCDRFYIINKYGDRCLGGIEQKCQYDEHCIDGAFCEHQRKCQCKEDFYPSEDGFVCASTTKFIPWMTHFYLALLTLFYS